MIRRQVSSLIGKLFKYKFQRGHAIKRIWSGNYLKAGSSLIGATLLDKNSKYLYPNIKKGSRQSMDLPEGILIGFGNPLLDITTTVEDNVLLEKYGLKPNAAIIADEQHFPLFEELTNQDVVQYSAGGACQNSMRIFQWILGKPYLSNFFGCVGRDKFGDMIAKRAMADGVETHYQITDEAPTGTCAVIISDKSRSLVANLGAAAMFTDDWMEIDENICYLDRAQYFYATGFFLAVSSRTVLMVAKRSSETNRFFVLNFSAVFVVQSHRKAIDEILPYTDLIIGNKQELLAYADVHDWNTKDIFDVGRQLQKLPKLNGRPRIVMITDAICPVLCFQENDKVLEYPVPVVDKKVVVDTNGCGDAFVGGFLSQLVQHMPLDYCIRTGIFASQQIMRIVGVRVEKLPKFNESCI